MGSKAAEDALRRLEVQERNTEALAKLGPIEPELELEEVFLVWESPALYEPGDVIGVFASEKGAMRAVARRVLRGSRSDFTVIPHEVKP